MKKNMIESVLLLAALAATTACQKDETAELEGTYTYKVSGTLTARTKEENEEERQTHTFNLVNEEGQMTLVEEDSETLLAACNALGGDAYTFRTEVKEDGTLKIKGNPDKSISVKDAALAVGHGNIYFSGYAKRYDNMLIFTCTYKGTITVAGTEMDITESDVEIIAKKN